MLLFLLLFLFFGEEDQQEINKTKGNHSSLMFFQIAFDSEWQLERSPICRGFTIFLRSSRKRCAWIEERERMRPSLQFTTEFGHAPKTVGRLVFVTLRLLSLEESVYIRCERRQ